MQEDNITELQREIIKLRKLVDDKRILETSNDMAPPPAATPLAGTPAATTSEVGNPAPTTATTQKTEAQAPRRTRIKSVVKRKLVKSSKLGPPFTTYPKKRRRSARVGARVVKSCNN